MRKRSVAPIFAAAVIIGGIIGFLHVLNELEKPIRAEHARVQGLIEEIKQSPACSRLVIERPVVVMGKKGLHLSDWVMLNMDLIDGYVVIWDKRRGLRRLEFKDPEDFFNVRAVIPGEKPDRFVHNDYCTKREATSI